MKLRSPSGVSCTKASVVGYSRVIRRPRTSTPASSIVFFKNAPKASSPTLPINAVLPPSFAAIASTLAGAPPGLRANSAIPWLFSPLGVKSIRLSPSATISNILSSSKFLAEFHLFPIGA